ncbi:MAG TPA: NAD-dependent epimerase/dehydratase family protein [Clostridiales bacterium]|nr:NAD-dependent epimerase/dehydratase family protein [Clostridiales bacterium]HQP69697.1 NAD-dependent epimerase/dehydratase family protein [Clostridiales bacterium]
MKILVLGGTLFLGKHIVERALKNGHEITLFNRGKHSSELFPETEKIKGDRDSDLEILQGRKWDAVIDTCGYIPRIVEKSAEILSKNVKTYVFISSISAYKDFSKPGINERSKLASLETEDKETLTNETYGALKAHCEARVKKHFPKRNVIIRPGLIVGPDDYSDRFTYWPVRIQKGGNIIIPKTTNYPIQFIDVRDLADFIILLLEKNKTGIFNATGPKNRFTFQELLDICIHFAKKDVNLIKMPGKFLARQLSENDCYLPLEESKGEWAGIEQIDCSKAINAGLKFRDVKKTVKDTLKWFGSLAEDHQMRAGLKPDIEKEIITEWKNRKI